MSNDCLITCGVPQGSKLGPLLFLIYVNDLPNCLIHSKATLFADDTTILAISDDVFQLRSDIAIDLILLKKWFTANKLTLNIDKTYGCEFGMKTVNANPLIVEDFEIKMSNSVKYLGINVDSKLSWKNHISYVCNKISRAIGVISKVRQNLNMKTLLLMYNSLVHSHLLYCIEIWGTAYKTSLQPLFLLQKRAVRLICDAGYRDHSEPLFKRLGIRNIFQEIKLRQQILSFDVVKNTGRYSFNIPTMHQHDHTTRFAENNIPLPKIRTDRFGLRGLIPQLVSAFNSIPKELKDLDNSRFNYVKWRLQEINRP